MNKTNIYQTVTDTIIASLENESAPWIKPWTTSGLRLSGDCNAITGHQYRGINTVLLWIAADKGQFESPLWLTFNQCRKSGGKVIKGSKGTQVVFWKILKGEDKETGKPTTFPMARAYTVFNIEQTEGVKLPKKHTVIDDPKDDQPVEYEQHIEDMIKRLNVDLHIGGNRAFFRPSNDEVHMPHAKDFTSMSLYYQTMLHELTHWTSHKDRCDRREVINSRFGTEGYAFEELVAEMGSAMSSTFLGLEMEGYMHQTAYLKSWLKVLKNDNKAIFKASSLAQKASDFLLDNVQDYSVKTEDTKAA